MTNKRKRASSSPAPAPAPTATATATDVLAMPALHDAIVRLPTRHNDNTINAIDDAVRTLDAVAEVGGGGVDVSHSLALLARKLAPPVPIDMPDPLAVKMPELKAVAAHFGLKCAQMTKAVLAASVRHVLGRRGPEELRRPIALWTRGIALGRADIALEKRETTRAIAKAAAAGAVKKRGLVEVCATYAKTAYFLTEDDLEDACVRHARNAYGPMRLFDLEDIEALAVTRHGSLRAAEAAVQMDVWRRENAQEAKKYPEVCRARAEKAARKRESYRRSLIESLRAIDPDIDIEAAMRTRGARMIMGGAGALPQNADRVVRELELAEALRARGGMELRADSRMCEQYIAGVGGWQLLHVVDTMDEMRFFFAHTRYASHYRTTERNLIEHLRGWGGYGYVHLDDDDRNECSVAAKAAALHDLVREHGVQGALDLAPPQTLHAQIRRAAAEGI